MLFNSFKQDDTILQISAVALLLYYIIWNSTMIRQLTASIALSSPGRPFRYRMSIISKNLDTFDSSCLASVPYSSFPPWLSVATILVLNPSHRIDVMC